MQNLHGVFTACSQRAHGALEDPTELPQRGNAKPRLFEHAQSKRRRMAF